jgi:hypothetical protein
MHEGQQCTGKSYVQPSPTSMPWLCETADLSAQVKLTQVKLTQVKLRACCICMPAGPLPTLPHPMLEHQPNTIQKPRGSITHLS